MQRIGVFVCWCGSNIAATVDVKAVAEALSHEPGVVFSTDYQYMCSQTGQELIQSKIQEYALTGVVVCSCSPRMHETTFRKTCEKAGLNPYMVEIANIREQCSWIHKDRAEATAKAIILGRAAVAKVQRNAPLTAGTSPVTKRALVIGGGIAGIQTALDIADAGFEVDIVEKEPTIGGKMTQIDKTFPTLDCAACILTPKMVDCAQNEKIHIYSYSEVESVKGFVGNFEVTIRKKARYVKEDVCTGCGLCTEKCPQRKVPNAFNLELDNRRAIYIPFAQAVPKVATIDANYCTMLKTGKCGVCSKVCTAGAIDYTQKDEHITQQYGAIVAATGFKPISLEKFDEFAYSQSPDVVSSLEFERLMNAAGPTGGTLLRPSDGTHPKTIVFVQCVGSRCDGGVKGKPYCSKICCMYTAKHAMLCREKYPDTDVYVFYIDVRTPGKNFDEFYRRAVEEYGVLPVDRDAFVGDVPEIENMVPFSPFHYYIERKLYIHNMGHAICAYLGHYLGHEYICTAIADPAIRLCAQSAMYDSAAALSKKYGTDIVPVTDHVGDLIRRFGNTALGDTCARVGGDIPRKLAKSDRLTGAFLQACGQGFFPVFICVGAAAALVEYNSENAEGERKTLSELCGLDAEHEFCRTVMRFVPMFEEGRPLTEIIALADEVKHEKIGMIV